MMKHRSHRSRKAIRITRYCSTTTKVLLRFRMSTKRNRLGKLNRQIISIWYYHQQAHRSQLGALNHQKCPRHWGQIKSMNIRPLSKSSLRRVLCRTTVVENYRTWADRKMVLKSQTIWCSMNWRGRPRHIIFHSRTFWKTKRNRLKHNEPRKWRISTNRLKREFKAKIKFTQ